MIEKILEVSQYTPQEAVIIGDGQPDIEVALRMGIKSIAVSYGYEPIEKLMALGAHHRIDQISELPTALKTLFP